MKSHELYSNAECFSKYNATHVTNFKELSPYNINSYSCSQEIPYFMEPTCSLQCSQHPVTCPCPQPDESSLCSPII